MTAGNCTPTSEATPDYNCAAWALWIDNRWVWPDEDEQYAWPPEIERSERPEAFVSFLNAAGFERCSNPDYEPAYEKIAIYVSDGLVTHLARSVNTKWTSKLGVAIDISHSSLEALQAGAYGFPAIYMRRVITGNPPLIPVLHPPEPTPPLLIGF